MSYCVPNLDPLSKFTALPHSSSISFTADVPTVDYEVAELTWENGQLAMHSLGPPRVPNKYTWDRPRAGGTLESIVNPAALLPHPESYVDGCDPGIYGVNELVPWFDHQGSAAAAPNATAAVVTTSAASASASASATMTMDALVPSSNNNNRNEEPSSHVMESGVGTCAVDCSARVGSCSAAAGFDGGMVARGGHEWSSCREQSVSGSATFGRDSRQVTLDTCDIELGVEGFTSTSMGSLGNTSSGTEKQCTKSVTGDDHDSACHSKPQREACDNGDNKKAKGKYSVSTKRSRAAAIHNQSERKRRDKINQRMKTLQKLVPNSSKTDKASMLDEVIEYLKQLQAQINMMSRMNMSPAMMLPMAMQQQLQMSMMSPMMGMGMGMGMGHVMDLNSMTRPNLPGLPPVIHPSVFMPMTSWDGSADRLPTPSSVLPDPLSTFLACQSQPMTMDAYSRMAALYQQMNQAPGPTPKN